MIKHSEYFTVSMAKAYSTQGHIDKALEIYKHLLKNSPGDTELQDAISHLETHDTAINHKSNNTKRDLSYLFEEWLDLLTKFKKIKTLKDLDLKIKTASKKIK